MGSVVRLRCNLNRNHVVGGDLVWTLDDMESRRAWNNFSMYDYKNDHEHWILSRYTVKRCAIHARFSGDIVVK